jgi:hypothetical protein
VEHGDLSRWSMETCPGGAWRPVPVEHGDLIREAIHRLRKLVWKGNQLPGWLLVTLAPPPPYLYREITLQAL